ncbi:PLAC8 motif-containing protein [Dillenia turbinata]|uniref:PLAC8 motif-containing protein n=1 Tax=Dillenia turbinata TaxID=194707 RepID=A0AAN8Z233_9MAGN
MGRTQSQASQPQPQNFAQPQAPSQWPPQPPPVQQFYHPRSSVTYPSRNPSTHQVDSNNNVGGGFQQFQQGGNPMFVSQQSYGMPQMAFQNQASLAQANSVNKTGFMGTEAWTTGLFDCMQDPSNAMITAIFPCVTFGQIADVLDNGHTTCATSGIVYAVSPCLLSKGYRRKLRQRFNLVEAPAQDWVVHSMFECCALCQEYRELNNRGLDPALGYHGNLEKHQKEMEKQDLAARMPPESQNMNQ